MSLPIHVPGWFAIILAFALILWACSTLPFRLGLQRLVKDPAKGVLLLLPGLLGLVLMHLVSRSTFGWDEAYLLSGTKGLPNSWLRDRLMFEVLVCGVAALIQLGGLGILLARERGKNAGMGLVAAIVPIVLVTVSVPLAREVLTWLLHTLFDWTKEYGAWFIWLVLKVFTVAVFVIGWFGVKWALNLFTRSVMGLHHPDAVYEVDAQFTADALGWTVWPLALMLGLVVPEVRFLVGDIGFSLDWPNLLAPQHCRWLAALPGIEHAFFRFFWDLVFMVVPTTMLIGHIDAYVRHRGVVTSPPAAH